MIGLASRKLWSRSVGPPPRYLSSNRKSERDKQVRQQDGYQTNAGDIVKTVCNTPPRPPFQRQHFRRSLYASIYSTQGIENDVSARLPNKTSASCDLDLWPPDPRGRSFIPLLPGKIYANLHWNRFIRFRSITFTSWWQTNRRTNGQTDGRRDRSRTLCVRPV